MTRQGYGREGRRGEITDKRDEARTGIETGVQKESTGGGVDAGLWRGRKGGGREIMNYGVCSIPKR